MRFIRRNALSWNIDTHKIGVIGFSAGGHLASTLSTQFNEKVYEVKDTTSARPDFSLLIYPVITMDELFIMKGYRSLVFLLNCIFSRKADMVTEWLSIWVLNHHGRNCA